jgi:palmitoyltransferase
MGRTDSRQFCGSKTEKKMPSRSISQLAVPAVSALIIFLAYTSQYLFLNIEPLPLSTEQLVKFNTLVACTWICYARACATDPGRIPADWQPQPVGTEREISQTRDDPSGDLSSRQRWCRRCEAFKPPRAHHCKTCQR